MAKQGFRLELVIRGRKIPDPNKIMLGLLAAVQDTVTEGVRTMATYPPQSLTATGYRRTGTLKRSWSDKVTPLGTRIVGIVGSNSNIAPYNETVQGLSPRPLFKRAGWSDVPLLKDQMERDLFRNATAVFQVL